MGVRDAREGDGEGAIDTGELDGAFEGELVDGA